MKCIARMFIISEGGVRSMDMKEEAVTDATLREFLLGNVNDPERESIESQFLTDSQARERILAIEQDLIEDYLEESLTTNDKEQFLRIYGRTTEQRRKLRITKSIKDWAKTEASLPQITSGKISGWDRVRAWHQARPAAVPIAVTVIITLIVIAIWFNRRTEQRNRQHSAIEQELVQLNSPASLREVPSNMTSLDLSPITLRSGEVAKIMTHDEIQIVELRLPWIQKRCCSTYQAEVRRVGDDESLTIHNLQAEPDGQSLIRVRLPARLLHRGAYKVQLTGTTADGSTSPPEEYEFAVSGQG